MIKYDWILNKIFCKIIFKVLLPLFLFLFGQQRKYNFKIYFISGWQKVQQNRYWEVKPQKKKKKYFLNEIGRA